MRTFRLFPSVLVLGAAVAALGCNNSSTGGGPSPTPEECHDADKAGCVITSDKQRITNAVVPSADQTSLMKGNSAFALDLYQQVRSKPGNLFYSPFSISMALAMSWAGARAET